MPLNSALSRRIGRGEFISIAPVIIEAQTGQFDDLLNFLARSDAQIRHQIPTFNQIAAVLPNTLIERLGAEQQVVEGVFFDDVVPVPLPPEPLAQVQAQNVTAMARNLLPSLPGTGMVETAAGVRPRDVLNQARFAASRFAPAPAPGPGIISTSTIRTLVGADVARNMGIEGTGSLLSILDTGIPGLGFLRRQPQLSNRIQRLGFDALPKPDRSGHGSFVATEAGGKAWTAPNGAVLEGIAPRCTMAGVKVLQTPLGIGRNSDILKGMEISRSWGANIINMSLGSNEWVPDNPFENPIRLMTGEGTIFCVAAGNCLTGDSRVSTVNGPIPIKDIKIGDEVYSASVDNLSLSSKTVTNTFQQGKKKIYEIQTRTRSIKATDNHPFLTIEKVLAHPGKKTHQYEYRLVWKTLKEIKPGDPLYVAKKFPGKEPDHTISSLLPSTLAGNDIVTPNLARVIGFYLGDGWYRIRPQNRGEVSFAIPRDAPYRDAYIDCFENLFGLKAHPSNYQVNFYSIQLAKEFAALGFPSGNGSSRTKRVPSWIFTAPEEVRIAFISGYLDADGTIKSNCKNGSTKRTCAARFEAHNPDLIRDIRDVAISVGLRASKISFRDRQVTIQTNNREYHYETRPYGFTLDAYSTKALRTFDPRYQSHIEEYTPERIFHYNHAFGRSLPTHLTSEYLGVDTVVSIEFRGYEETYDITVEGHNFIAEGLVVHNSGPQARTVGTPGGSPMVWAIGSINTRGLTSAFSSRGPAGPRIKPDFVTYGGDNAENPATGTDERIMSTTSIGSVADRSDRRKADSIGELMGSSMATPVAAGIFALMNEWKIKNRGSALTNQDVLKIAQASGRTQNNDQGYGPLNFNMVSVL